MSEYLFLEFLRRTNLNQYNELMEVRQYHPDKYPLQLEIVQDMYRDERYGVFEPKVIVNELLVEYDFSKEATLKYLKEPFTWDECKLITQESYKRTNTLNVFFGSEKVMQGKVVSKLFDFKEEMTLAQFVSRSTDLGFVEKLVFFDTTENLKRWKIEEKIQASFWMYQYESNNRKYILLSKEELPMEYLIIEGTPIKLEDMVKIGQNKLLNITLPVIIVNNHRLVKSTFKTKKELIQKTKGINLNHQSYFNWLFYNSDEDKTFNHPQYFQYLISAHMLSASYTYPLHLTVVAVQGTGKSTLLDSLWQKSGEDIEIVEGSQSTMKALIPSFKGNIPDPGAILKANRFSMVDELLRILMRVDKDDRQVQLSSLNPILEHRKKRKISSGNGEIRANPTSRILTVTNPVWGTNSMEMLCDHIDPSFVSRLLVWYQDKDHINYIQTEKGIQDNYFKIDMDLWIGIIDFLHSFKSDFDNDKVQEIYEKGLLLLGDDTESNLMRDVRSVYTARYLHHIRCLLDGIIKTRCICTGDDSFSVKDVDYVSLERIWIRMLMGWGVSLNDIEKTTLVNEIYTNNEK